jgi:hypothetical protein
MRIRASLVLLATILLALFGLGSTTPASGQSALTSTINGIEVPEDVLSGVQFQYPGEAVTNVSRTFGGYRLTVDSDDIPNNGPVTILQFDSQWKFTATQQVDMTPPPAPKPEVTPSPKAPEAQSGEPQEPENNQNPSTPNTDDETTDPVQPMPQPRETPQSPATMTPRTPRTPVTPPTDSQQ